MPSVIYRHEIPISSLKKNFCYPGNGTRKTFFENCFRYSGKGKTPLNAGGTAAVPETPAAVPLDSAAFAMIYY